MKQKYKSKGLNMTIETLENRIEYYILKRREAKDQNEQCRINAQLTKLYDLKYLALQQQNKFYTN